MKYLVTGSITISMHVEVEADSPAEARQIARDAPLSLGYQCSRYTDGEWRITGELDGDVRIRRDGVEEA